MWIVTPRGNIYSSPVPVNLNVFKYHDVKLPWRKVSVLNFVGKFLFLGAMEAWAVTKEGKVYRQTGLSRLKSSHCHIIKIPVQAIVEDRIVYIEVSNFSAICLYHILYIYICLLSFYIVLNSQM